MLDSRSVSMFGKCVALAGMVAAGMAVVCMTAAERAAANHSTGHVTQGAQEHPGKELFTERCNSCHAIATVTVRRASAEEWHEIVDRMVTYGAQVNEAEVEAIVSYLAKKYGPESEL